MKNPPMSPGAVVQRQVEAYNARDPARFVAEYSDSVKLFRPPSTEPAIAGKAALADFYATQRFSIAGLHAKILNRMVLGNKVIDHERITGVWDVPREVAAVYEVVDGLIRTAWFYSSE